MHAALQRTCTLLLTARRHGCASSRAPAASRSGSLYMLPRGSWSGATGACCSAGAQALAHAAQAERSWSHGEPPSIDGAAGERSRAAPAAWVPLWRCVGDLLSAHTTLPATPPACSSPLMPIGRSCELTVAACALLRRSFCAAPLSVRACLTCWPGSRCSTNGCALAVLPG
jgi:hypothetical protein